MNKLEAAARQALVFIESLTGLHIEVKEEQDEIITALREALAEQAEQEPVAWVEVERGIPMFMDFAEDYKPNIGNGIAPLYAALVRTKDLTDGEILMCVKSQSIIETVRRAIDVYKEKNK